MKALKNNGKAKMSLPSKASFITINNDKKWTHIEEERKIGERVKEE